MSVQAVFIQGRHEGKHGLACWWWALSNGLDVFDVVGNIFASYDEGEKAADVAFFARDAAGSRILGNGGFLKLVKRTPIKYAPSMFGIEMAVSA